MSNRYFITLPADKDANQLLLQVSDLFQNFQHTRIYDLSLREPTLDDVFLELTGSKLRD